MLKVSFQGAYGAYSHIACKELYPDAEYVACDTFEQAMEVVQNSYVDYAVIPVENSNAGRVSDVHFLLKKTGLKIIAEHFLRVEHQLLALKGTKLSDIKAVASHPQALAQCSNFLQEHSIKALARIDTAKSCERIVELGDNTRGAIASKLAGQLYQLEVLASNIENNSNNTTRFLVMKNNAIEPINNGGKFITSLLFTVKNIPAALYKALGGFATNNVNIIKIESYVIDENFISAQFYIEVIAHPKSKEFLLAIEELQFYSKDINYLGTYPSAR